MKIKRISKLKTNTSGFGHIEMLLLVVAVVVIGGVGFFVYQNQNKKTASKSTAHAGGWTLLNTGILTNTKGYRNTVKLYACAQASVWGNTPIWIIKSGYTSSDIHYVINAYEEISPGGYGLPTTKPQQQHNAAIGSSWYIMPDLIINHANRDMAGMRVDMGGNQLISYIGGNSGLITLGSVHQPGFGGFGNPLYVSFFGDQSPTPRAISAC